MYNKQGLLDLAKGLIKHDIRLLASGGTAKRKFFISRLELIPPYRSHFVNVSTDYERTVIREAGFEVE